ncbi:hypothetical protein DTO166G5_6098 [Paecilomyces variotii]|nr:hypothetical protein DTO166G5_6098 [Paecilomyces variotii]
MQIDSELYEQYDKEWVARALWDPVEYQSFRNNQLRIQRAAIEQFPNSAALIADSQDRINWIEKHTPAGPVFPPSEPIGLTLLAYHCIERLKYSLAHMPFLSESKRVNINAVIRTYRSGSLIPKPGDITYWYAGIQKEDPGPPGQRDEALARWTKEHGEGSMWIESVVPMHNCSPQMASLPNPIYLPTVTSRT